MLLSEATASSIKVLCKRFREAIPNMTDKELYNCLRILNKSQTEAEKLSASTIDKNGKGFTSNDAEQLTNAIKEYLQNGSRCPRPHGARRSACRNQLLPPLRGRTP